MSLYRFTLERRWSDGSRRLGVCMVNPSTAESDVLGADDNTIRSLIRIATGAGFDGLVVGNVSPFRATNPIDLVDSLQAGIDVFQREENDRHLVDVCRRCEVVVCAWGAVVGRHPALEERASQVRELLLTHARRLHCFGKTKEGWPKHPLYLAATTPIVPFAAASER